MAASLCFLQAFAVVAVHARYMHFLCLQSSVRIFDIAAFWAWLAILLIQAGLIFWLVMQIRRRRQLDRSIRHLTRRLIKASEDQRRSLARELHDDFGQRLSLIAVQLGSLYQRFSNENARNKSDLCESIHELDALISDMHTLSHRLHSSKLEHLGLEAALKELCLQISQRHDIQVDLQINGQCTDLRSDISLCFYRVAQEALSNAVKHSCTSLVKIILTANADKVKMQVKDSGIGFNHANVVYGLGLVTMEERLRAVRGAFAIVSKSGEGTMVSVEAPFAHNKHGNGSTGGSENQQKVKIPC